MSDKSKYQQFTETTHSGRELLKKHSLDEAGTWQVFGEDPNCDWGGSHHQPNLGLYEGILKDVIEHAVNLPGFWQWGGGGNISKHTRPAVIKVNPETNRIRNQLTAEKARLEAELARINKSMEQL